MPDKSRILEVAEAIGDTTLAPSIGDAERAKKWLLLLGDECYRQRDEIERLKTENERLMRCCGKDEMRTDIDCLRAENAELRGIIRGEREIAEGKTVTYEV